MAKLKRGAVVKVDWGRGLVGWLPFLAQKYRPNDLNPSRQFQGGHIVTGPMWICGWCSCGGRGGWDGRAKDGGGVASRLSPLPQSIWTHKRDGVVVVGGMCSYVPIWNVDIGTASVCGWVWGRLILPPHETVMINTIRLSDSLC